MWLAKCRSACKSTKQLTVQRASLCNELAIQCMAGDEEDEQVVVLTSVSSRHCFWMSLATISMRGLLKTYLRSSLINSASSRKHSSMLWKAATKQGSRTGFSVAGFSQIYSTRELLIRHMKWLETVPKAQCSDITFCRGRRWM